MATNLAIDDALLSEAQRAGKLKTKRETVNMALKEFIQSRKQEEILDLFGQVEYEPGYNYKRLRDHS
jgi:Arc/MetJ family transcription regulator